MDNSANHPATAAERKIILLLCLLAAVHVFVFSAAFPFFNVVDEQMHVDLAVKYAQGKIPRTLAAADAEAAPFLVVYASPEFLQTNATVPPPAWKQPIAAVRETLATKQNFYRTTFQNHESAQPPLYYSIAGAWWRLGKTNWLDGGQLLYWLRFLNVPLVGALAWLAWHTARKVFPENLFLRLAVPAFIAFLPQTAFYSVNNDILSPLTFGAAFLLLLKFAETPNPRLAAATGLALAATFLTKISNLPLLAAATIFIVFKFVEIFRTGKIRSSIPVLTTLAACAGLPVAAWLAWCKINFGDFTGTAAKIQFLGWTHQPFAVWWHHPIFTLTGAWTFISGLLATFWQGESLWHRQPLGWPAANVIYAVTSLIFMGFALWPLWRRPQTTTAAQRTALWFSLASFAAAVGFLGFLSISYDFQDCFYPSRAHPYFTSGRLLLGALIPFLLLFTFGLDRALGKCRNAIKFSVLALLLIAMLVAETALDWKIFSSEYNWFHL